jgi:adenine-specific DNA-methyltransferase
MKDTITPLIEKDGESKDLVAENIEKLKQLFPEIVTEGKVDFETLQEVLGDFKEDSQERYSFTWNGKSKARKLAMTPSRGTLRPAPEESVNWDRTENLFIEGDNLEVLKLLQRSYHSKVKLIYIDPSYNTGKDFVYFDNYKNTLKNYLVQTGQIDDEGRKVSSNTENSGRYHTDWLNMIFPRLKLARELLKDDGVIFISIDDHEQANLKKVCDEVFGEENLLGVISCTNNPKGRSDDNFIATAHEYLLVYAKDKNEAKIWGFEPSEKITKRYNKVDENGKKYRDIDLRKTGDEDRREDRQDMFYYFMYNKKDKKLRVSKTDDSTKNEISIKPLRDDNSEGRWRWGYDTSKKDIDKLFAKFMPNREIWGVFEYDYLEGRPPVKPTSSWTFKDINSERGSEAFIDLGFEKEVFSRPKPVGLLKRVLKVGLLPKKKEIVLDFFAGSSVIFQAYHELLAEGKREAKIISVQLPELLDPDKKESKRGYKFCIDMGLPPNLAEISKERIRRSIDKYFGDHNQEGLDAGFKVFKLNTSNIKPWDPNFDEVQLSIEDSIENVKAGRSDLDVLYEILLKYGLDLSLPIEAKEIAGSKVFVAGAGALFICLAPNIDLDVVEGIAKQKEELEPELTRVVFRDSGFKDDVVKTNAVQILKQHGIEDVRSI